MGKKVHKIELALLISLFSIHLLLLERYKDNFLEYDVHAVIIITGIVVLLRLMHLWNANAISVFSFDKISAVAFLLVLLITVHSFLNDLSNRHYIWLTWAWYILFIMFKNQSVETDFVIKSFVISVSIVLMIELFDISFLNYGRFYVGQINTGENANYLVTTIPFLFSVTLQHCDKKMGRVYIVLRCIAMIGFFVAVYLTVISSARIASFAGFLGIAIVLESKFQFTKSKKFSDKIFLTKTVICVILILFTTVVTYISYSSNSDSVKGRFLIYKVSSSMLSSEYKFGIGIQRFKDVYNNYQFEFISKNQPPLSEQLLADDTFFAFNEFLQIGIELGIFGLCLVIIFCILIFNIRSQNILMIGAKASIISTLICCLFSYPLRSTSVLINIIFFISILVRNSDVRQYLYSVNTRKIKLLLMITFIGCGYILSTEYNRIYSLHLWKQAAHLAQEDRFVEARPLYQKCYYTLKTNGNFLFNYGSERFIAGDTIQSLFLLEAASLRISHCNLFIYMGNNYNRLRQYDKAEQCYLKSIHMVPSRFLPKHLLFLMYKNQGRKSNALSMAKEILNFPVKFQSPKIDEYKKISQDYISQF